jgi:hypothetical protein
MDPSSLTDKPEHGGHVEGHQRQGLRTNAIVEVVVAGTWGGGVVVLEDGSSFHDAPAEGTDPCAARIDVGKAVDTPPGALGTVEGWAVGRARHDAEPGMRVAVAGQSLGVVVVPVVLPDNLGREVTA